jgi:UDP-2,4-diacetamido-2,4,6-trideoxy-beta-L-altropyranose hydrolase
MKPEVLMRVDGNSLIGLGHIVRCMALAHMLKESFTIIFVSKEITKILQKELLDASFKFIKVKNEEDFINLLVAHHIVVLDGYDFDTQLQVRIKEKGCKLVCIDDMHEKKFIADLIINHTPGITPQEYLSKPYTQFALGFDYALLRPAFLEQAKTKRKIEKIETILICFGGSDPKNLTESTLKIIVGFSQFKKILVVTGSAFRKTKNFKNLITIDSRIEYRAALSEYQMVDTLLEAECAIVPASSILYEVLACNCQVISGIYVDNQKLVYENIKKIGSFIDAGNFLESEILQSISKVLVKSEASKNLIDGLSSRRILKLFDQLQKEFNFNLRDAEMYDLDLTYDWASNRRIREHSFQQHQIKKKEHYKWFISKISDTDCCYYIAEYDSKPIGSIRFDIKNGEAIISYLIEPTNQGLGFGQILLRKGIMRFLEFDTSLNKRIFSISGEVMRNNIPSIKAFERLGFIKMELVESYKFQKWL